MQLSIELGVGGKGRKEKCQNRTYKLHSSLASALKSAVTDTGACPAENAPGVSSLLQEGTCGIQLLWSLPFAFQTKKDHCPPGN